MAPKRILVVGSSDGIGLATSRRLLDDGWQVVGISRRRGPLEHPAYRHEVIDVGQPGYRAKLSGLVGEAPFGACLYCAGIGAVCNPAELGPDLQVFQVDLMAAVETAAELLPPMLEAGHGHFVVLSSQADRLITPEYASYAAAKAAVSSYFEALALRVRASGVKVTNIRFGFVDTKMSKGPLRPFLRSADWAANVAVRALAGKAIRVTRPRRMAPLVALLRWLTDWRIRLS